MSNDRHQPPDVSISSGPDGCVHVSISAPLVLSPKQAFELASQLMEHAKLAKAAKARETPQV
jgi:hypothetical protein